MARAPGGVLFRNVPLGSRVLSKPFQHIGRGVRIPGERLENLFVVVRQRPQLTRSRRKIAGDRCSYLHVLIGRELSEQHWLSAYHRRRTSGCSGSVVEAHIEELERTTRAMVEDPAVLPELVRRGYTTVVVHHPPGSEFHARYASAVERMRSMAGSSCSHFGPATAKDRERRS